MAAAAVQHSQPFPLAAKLRIDDVPVKGGSDSPSSDQSSPIQVTTSVSIEKCVWSDWQMAAV